MNKQVSLEELKSEWAEDNEKDLGAYSPGSNVVGWWVCGKGHRWVARIRSRVRGSGCPFCSGRLAVPGETDLATANPCLAQQWDAEKNGDVTPGDVTPYSNKVMWWRCDKGHSWQATVSKRSMGKGCPYCNHKRADKDNNLAVLYPGVATQWDEERNGKKASEVLPHSNAYAAWICENGHRWVATVSSRTKTVRPCRCPYCSGRISVPGETDLATTDPGLAAEWDGSRNLLTPDEVSRFSHKKVYWNCPEGHTYRMTVANRALGKGCPVCASRRMRYGRI